jgi:hypothetical protein
MEDCVVLQPSHADLRSANQFETLSRAFQNDYFFPLIFLPLTAKPHHLVQGFYERMVDAGTSLMSQAEEILFIGYRANDAIIREMLKVVKRKAILHIIGKGGAREVASRVTAWAKGLELGMVYEDGFMEFVRRKL